MSAEIDVFDLELEYLVAFIKILKPRLFQTQLTDCLKRRRKHNQIVNVF